MKKINKKYIKKALLYVLLVYLAIIMIWGKKIRRASLSYRISHNLESRYNTKFTTDSMAIYGGGVDFVCHPRNDPTLMFDGYGDSDTGSISYDTYPGAIIARADTAVLSSSLTDFFPEVFVYGRPVHRGQLTVDAVISAGDFTLDDLHKKAYAPELLFYVFIYTSKEYPEYDQEYDALENAINELTNMYSDKYGQTICVTMNIYYMNPEMMDYTRSFFTNHIYVDYEFERETNPIGNINIQMGSENQFYSESLRMTKEEYVEERERMENYE